MNAGLVPRLRAEEKPVATLAPDGARPALTQLVSAVLTAADPGPDQARRDRDAVRIGDLLAEPGGRATGRTELAEALRGRLRTVLIVDQFEKDLMGCYQRSDPTVARDAADRLITDARACPTPEIARNGRTLRAGRPEFLAHFDHPDVSNGPTESIKLKVLASLSPPYSHACHALAPATSNDVMMISTLPAVHVPRTGRATSFERHLTGLAQGVCSWSPLATLSSDGVDRCVRSAEEMWPHSGCRAEG